MPTPPLTELHLHYYGCLRAGDVLEMLTRADPERIDWDAYETAMRDAFGTVPRTRELVERHHAGEAVDPAEFEALFVMGEADAGDFAKFLAKFTLVSLASDVKPPFGTPEEMAAETVWAAAALAAEHRREGVEYAEIRALLGPDLRTERNTIIIDTLMAAFAGTPERLVLGLDRQDPWPGWERVKELALGPGGDVLVGVDFCHIEEGFPPKDKAALFADVHAFNAEHPDRALAILYHVGESFTDKSLESAVRWVHEAAELGAHRLGHAIALGVDPDVYGPHKRTESAAERLDQIAYDLAHADGLSAYGVRVDRAALTAERAELAAAPDGTVTVAYDHARLDEVRLRQRYAMHAIAGIGAVVEVCPTSNVRIGGIADAAHHPVHRFHAEGLPFVVSSDDPGIFGTTITREMDLVCEWTGEDLREELAERAWRSRSVVLTGRITD